MHVHTELAKGSAVRLFPFADRFHCRGTKELNTGNVGEPVSEVVDEDSELMRDFLLRHALFYPKQGDVELSVQSEVPSTTESAAGEALGGEKGRKGRRPSWESAANFADACLLRALPGAFQSRPCVCC